jgi:hypothetical protein
MANYITTLQTENAALKAQIDAMDQTIVDFLAHCESDKFQGDDAQWIAIRDVHNRLRDIQAAGHDAYVGA